MLEVSKKKLRSFGLLVGGIFILISIWFFFAAISETFAYIFVILGSALFLSGLAIPLSLKVTYKFWMGIAFAIGWVVSRILLILLYYMIVFPISLLANIFKKEFLDLKFKGNKDSYWIPKPQDEQINYKKMY